MSEEKKSYSLFALNIVKAKARKIFQENKALSCLIKSDYFFKEILNFFGELFYCEILPDKFLGAVQACSLSKTDSSRLHLISEVYKSYVETMNENGFVLPLPDFAEKKQFFAANENIKKRLDFLLNLFEKGKRKKIEEAQTENIEYLEFSDIQNESMYVVNEIKKLTLSGEANYSDFAVFVDKSEARQKFLDLMKAENLPVVSSIYNENYENLKHKISVYKKICEICIELELNSFCSEDFKKINLPSKAKEEISFSELDEVLKNLLSEILTDGYAVDKVLSLKENSKIKSVIEAVFSSWNSFSESDREILVKEFSSIKNFYGFFKENNYAKAIESVLKRYFESFGESEIKDVAAGKIKSLNELQSLYDTVLNEKPDFDSFFEIMEWLPADKSKEKNAILLASISSKIKKDCKFVFVSGLTENNFPGTNPSYPFISADADEKITIEIKKTNPKFDHIIKTDEQYFSKRFYAFCSVMALAKEKISFTTHIYEAKKQTQPSVFFKALAESDRLNFKRVEDETPDIAPLEKAVEHEAKNIAPQKVIGETDILKLNPSAVSTFQNCPRKYFYKNLLNLKEPSTFSASYGNVVHAVFEVLHRKYLTKFTKEVTFELAEILLNVKNDEEKVLKAGFNQTDVELVKASDDLSIAEMRDNFKDAVEDLSYKGFFDHVPDFAVCEKSFSFTLEELPNIVFDGRIDAIVQNGEKLSVIDYKTGKDKDNSLAYAISENGVNFKTEAGKDPTNVESYQKRYDYQIPLYYLAAQNSSDLAEFREKITELGLLYIRPKTKNDGCDEDFISAERIEQFKEKIIQNLKETVIDKIISEMEFKKSTGWNCDGCAYKFLCDGGEEDE